MFIRIISALFSIPLLIFVVFKGGFLLKIVVLILALKGIDEFYTAFHNIGIMPYKKIGFISVLLMFVTTLTHTTMNLIILWFFSSILLVLLHNLFKKDANVIASSITLIGIYYIVFFVYHIIFIENYSNYHMLIWMVFISAWATDTFAYFTGYFLGSKKLCPNISPKKTVEGALGGIIGSVLSSFLFAYYVIPELTVHCMIIGFIGSILGQIGDLTASIFKRQAGIKDYGKIMPGHGGILDRFDSILFTAPAVYYYMILFIK
ncbi:phosphatidate cytidylyltransferase [Clostridiaceae bacterium 35-E11]